MSTLCRCGDDQDQHRRGTGGCREPECGCGRFEEVATPADEPGGPAELDSLNVAELFAEAVADHDREVELAARLAEAERGAAEVAMELAALQLRHAREVREVAQEREEACTLLLAAQRELVPTVDALEQAREQLAEVELQRDEFARLVDQKQDRIGEYSDLLTASRAKVESVERERDMAQAKLDSALLQAAAHIAELERPAVDVLGAYDAWQCVGSGPHCGRRFYSDDAQCGHGPLTPVTVTISRRLAGDTSTENRSTTA